MNKIEYKKYSDYSKSGILFTAEHSLIKFVDHAGGRFGIGDRNTEILAKIAANYIKSAYAIPLFSRIDADASRNPKDFYDMLFLRSTGDHIKINKNKDMKKYVVEYHKIIEKFNPNAIVSFHGMGRNASKKYDILLCFGKNHEYILGKKNAFKFRKEFKNNMKKKGIKLRVGIGHKLFTGRKNYILKKFVYENNKNKKKRIGIQVEFSRNIRVDKNRKPEKQCETAVKIMASTIEKFVKNVVL